MKFLIAGLGSIGRRHLRNLRTALGEEHGEHEIVLYRTYRGSLPDEELAGLPVETDLQAALRRRPDAVIVSNPTALHLPVAIPAAQAGCCLLIEKPISHTLDGIGDLQAAVKSGGGQVLVGYHFRFHPGLQQAARWLADGVIGRPVSARAHWGEYLPGWHPWEDYRQGYSARADLGGGVILTLSHPLDYLRWLFGPAACVWALAGSLGTLGIEVEDTAEIGLQFENGTLGSAHLDYNQLPPEHTLEVVGTQGTLRWENASGAASLYQANRPEAGWQTAALPVEFERNDLFLAEMRHFLNVVRGQARPLCTLEDGIEALRLALAAMQSAQYGQLVRLGG